jgi:hypothetical protein
MKPATTHRQPAGRKSVCQVGVNGERITTSSSAAAAADVAQVAGGGSKLRCARGSWKLKMTAESARKLPASQYIKTVRKF